MKKILVITAILFLFSLQNISAQGWQWIDTGFPMHIFDMCFPSGQSNIGFAVGSSLPFSGDGTILKTTNGGFTWFKISTDTIPGLKTVCFTSLNVGYAAGFQNFLMKTTDGGINWAQQVIDDKLWYFNNLEFWDANAGIIVSYPSLVYRTTDAGTTWDSTIGVKHSVEDICYSDANSLYLVGGDEKIYKSTNSGFYWTEIFSGTPLNTFYGVEFYNSNFGMVCGENGQVLVTTNGGTDWSVNTLLGNGLLKSLHIFTLSNAYVIGTPEQVFKTTDSGINWISDFNGANNIALYKIKFTENLTALICGSEGKFLINTDYVIPVELTGFTAIVNGDDVQLNWTTKTELNNSGFEIQRLAHGSSWEIISFVPGFGTTTETRDYSFTDEQLKSGSYFYRLKQIDFDGSFEYSDIVNVFVSVPEVFKLEQNYPNPFNPNTMIRYQLPVSINVMLKVYDILGNEVATLVDEEKPAGIYEVEFSSRSGLSGISDLPSGIYFYGLGTDKYFAMKKMILIK